jgi:hypothetical protein
MEPLRRTKLAELLEQQVQLLQKIDRLKISAVSEIRQATINRLLGKMSQPVSWRVKQGKGPEVQMDTPAILRARELKELYQAMMRYDDASIDERLQVLLHVKYTVKEFDSPLTREIVGLIDREGDLISRGRDQTSLSGLRQRLGNLFLQFVQTPEFNPQAARFSRLPVLKAATQQMSTQMDQQKQQELAATKQALVVVEQHPEATKQLEKANQVSTVPAVNHMPIYFCRACARYLPSTSFYLHTTMRHLGKCKACTLQQNQAFQRMNEEGVRRMNEWIRVEEAKRIRDLTALLERIAGTEAKRIIRIAIGYYGITGQWDEEDAQDLMEVMQQRLSRNDMTWMLISDTDVRYVVETIWKGTSAISSSAQTQFKIVESSTSAAVQEASAGERAREVLQGAMQAAKTKLPNIFSEQKQEVTSHDIGQVDYDGLILTRWDPLLPLSPWNALLLTKQEAVAHDRHVMALAVQQLVEAIKRKPSDKRTFKLVSAPELLYSDTFVRQIKAKHWMARQHFDQLISMETTLIEKRIDKREKRQQQVSARSKRVQSDQTQLMTSESDAESSAPLDNQPAEPLIVTLIDNASHESQNDAAILQAHVVENINQIIADANAAPESPSDAQQESPLAVSADPAETPAATEAATVVAVGEQALTAF